MDKKKLTFCEVEVEKDKCYCHKSPIFSEDADHEKVLVSIKISAGGINYKYCIGYLYNDYKVKPLHIMLPKTTACVKSYDGQAKWMYISFEDNVKKYNTVCDKICAVIMK